MSIEGQGYFLTLAQGRVHTNIQTEFSQKRQCCSKPNFVCLTAVSGVGSSPALATCETSQVLLAGVSGGFPGVLPFRPPIDWLVSMSEIILKGTLN